MLRSNWKKKLNLMTSQFARFEKAVYRLTQLVLPDVVLGVGVDDAGGGRTVGAIELAGARRGCGSWF